MNKLRNKPSTPPKFETKSKPVILVDLLTRLFSKLELYTENITRLSFHFLGNLISANKSSGRCHSLH